MICRGNTLLLFMYVFVRVLMRMCMSILLFMCLSILMHVLVQLPVFMALPSCATDARIISARVSVFGIPPPRRSSGPDKFRAGVYF